MNTYFGFESCKCLEKVVVTLGSFDGLHRGHRVILQRLNDAAKASGAESMVVTFEPSPNRDYLNQISSLKQRLASFAEAGIQHVLILPYEDRYCEADGKLFILRSLTAKVGVEQVLFGYDQECVRQLSELPGREYGKVEGIQFEEIEAVKEADTPPSSGEIRMLIEAGLIESANRLLGYDFTIVGKLSHRITFDRVNKIVQGTLEPEEQGQLMPAEGCYEVVITHNENEYQGDAEIIAAEDGTRHLHFAICKFNESIIKEHVSVRFTGNLIPKALSNALNTDPFKK